MNLKLLPIALALACSPLVSPAQEAGPNEKPLPQSNWAAWGGTVGVRLEKSNLSGIGITVSKPSNALPLGSPRLTDGLNVTQAQDVDLFSMRQSGSIEFTASRGSFAGFLGGSLQVRGGYVLTLADGSTIPMLDFRLRPSATDSKQLDVISGDGKAWFYVDKLMYELVNDNRVMAFYTSDMRISKALAERTGHPDMVNQPAGELEILTQVTRQGAGGAKDALAVPSPSHWHGDPVPGQPGKFYQADLFMQSITIFKVQSENNTGPNGSGRVAFAPSSTLRNNVNNGSLQTTIAGQGALGISTAEYTAWIPWYSKFTSPQAPYGNDQHPFLIWNMYRINADGGIEQIGRSGVKHAFLTLNNGCAAGEDFDSHVLGRSCGDTYSSGNNDSNSALGVRSEIIPSTNQWGRCHSIFDPGCTGSFTTTPPDGGGFNRRLVVNESQISNTVHPGATYLFDSWYLARQDINIYNSMASVTGTPTWSGSNWTFAGQSNYKLGSVTDRWVENLAANTTAQNSELAISEGHTKVAVRVIDLGNGQYRYHYAVHNLDYSRPVTAGAEPNLDVISNKGFDRFRVAVPAGTNVVDNRFSDGDLDGGNDWTFSNSGGYLTWTAPAGASLDWGSLYLFTVTTSSAPAAGSSELRPATAGSPSVYDVPTLIPALSDIIFQHGFE
ncbi:MAG: hypothetical protein KDK91_00865 [Gammaproteobacteria bacterium]|nr:hypothetical protein [Gammaproteobacteria bacterium]